MSQIRRDSNLNEAEIVDTLGTDDEMPRVSVAMWDINEYFLMARQLLNIIGYVEYSPMILRA